MTTLLRIFPLSLAVLASVVLLGSPAPSGAVEMRVSRDAMERTLKQQLFAGPDGRYYLKGSPRSACSTYAEDPRLTFVEDRIVVRVKTHALLGKSVRGACLGLPLSVPAEVSLSPEAEGETIGFRDARLDRVSDQKELNFLLSPFLSHQIPASMKVNAADLLRKALAGSTATSGYKVTLDRLKIHSVQIEGDTLVVDVDGALSVK
ncbi:MAG TPA: hypothetical protein VMW15_01840 [Terracidiphilus sp.]|jgi:hypothetical protein|nr:hypothetical protein [Terracidiphilus sp.]